MLPLGLIHPSAWKGRSRNFELRGFYKARRRLTVLGRVFFRATRPPAPVIQRFPGNRVDEPRDEPQTREDVDRREELAEGGGRGDVAQAHGRQSGDIHRSSWNWNSQKFACDAFSELPLDSVLRRSWAQEHGKRAQARDCGPLLAAGNGGGGRFERCTHVR